MDVDTRSTKGKRFNGVDFSVLFDRLYVQIIHQYPVTTLILSIVCFLIAPLIVLYFFPISLGISPEKVRTHINFFLLLLNLLPLNDAVFKGKINHKVV